MTDRELLEKAATAAGLLLVLWQPDGTPHASKPGDTVSWPWNPLSDDGDALRLMVKLRIDACFGSDMLWTQTTIAPTPMFTERFGSNLYAATRRAIVRAAAAMAGENAAEPHEASGTK